MGSMFSNLARNVVVNPLEKLQQLSTAPLGMIGKNSFIANLAGKDPLLGPHGLMPGVGKFLAPQLYEKGQQNWAQNHVPIGPGGAFSGVAPTLADAAGGYGSGPAQNGYVTAAQRAAQKVQPAQQAQATPQVPQNNGW